MAETNLEQLLATMQATLLPGEFVFVTMPPAQRCSVVLEAVCEFRETEGVSLILLRSEAERLALGYTYPCRQITLAVHSSLEAIGFLAAITTRLATVGISVNAQSAYFHDHLFVPMARADEALQLLHGLAEESKY